VITVNPLAPTAAVGGSATICAGNSTTITANLTGTAPFIVRWNDGFGQTINAGTVASRSVSPGITVAYTVTSVADANGCSQAGTGSAAITVNQPPGISNYTATPTTIGFGGGSTLTFTITNGATWTLSSSIGNTFSQSSGTGSGTFTVTYGAGNNTGTDTVTLNVTNAPCTSTSGTVTIIVK
jgi:hypothetical protein